MVPWADGCQKEQEEDVICWPSTVARVLVVVGAAEANLVVQINTSRY